MGSYMAKKETVERGWFVVDAAGRQPGRIASRIARVLMGKHRPVYTPHVDTGEHVIVVNAAQVAFSGRKHDDKQYFKYSGYPGGLKVRSARDVLATKPEDVVYLAVRRMLPKTRLGRQMIRKLKVYAGPDHPHEAQRPVPLEL